jgi:ABC-2 type transport system permease protein
LLPLISSAVFLVAGYINNNQSSESNPLVEMVTPKENLLPDGLIDDSGIVKFIPDDIQDQLIRFNKIEMAQTALENGKINGYYYIPEDFMTSGSVIAYQENYNVMGGMENTWVVKETLHSNLLLSAGISSEQFSQPLGDIKVVKATSEVAKPEPEPRASDQTLSYIVPYIVSLLFYVIIMTTSSMLMNSITTEKENRIMEILLTSIDPETMLAGKILSRGVVGILQFLLWGGTGWLLLQFSGQTFQMADQFKLPPEFLLWSLLFILLGYGLYATLMAAVGALAPNIRESSQITILFVLPMIVPLMFVSIFSQSPNQALPVFLSYFPLTSPLAMMMRLSVTEIPIWEMFLSALILAGTAYLCLRLVAGLFRADVLLSGESLNAKRYFKVLLKRNR